MRIPVLQRLPVLKKGEQVLLFLQRSDEGYAVLQGFLGKITVANEIAGPIYLASQPEKIAVKKLIIEIESILKRVI
jgi:hypothetical protein